MKKGMNKNSLVFGIIVVCVAATMVPCIGGAGTRTTMKQEPAQMTLHTPPTEIWNKTIGGANDDAAYDVQQTTDGGFIVAGYSKSFGIAMQNPWLIKTDSDGNEVWNRTYSYYSLSNYSGYIRSVQQTHDNGYILGCTFYNTMLQKSLKLSTFDHIRGFLSSMVLIKTDAQGNEQWNRTYADIAYSWCYCVRQTTDNGYIVTGGGNETSNGFVDVYLLKTYPNGTMQWLKTYGESEMDEEGHWAQQTSDNGYIITGMSDCNYDTDWGKMWLIKTDASGTMQWDKKFEGTLGPSRFGPDTYGNSVQQTSDNGFIVAGTLDGNGCLIKTDLNGNETWRKTPFLSDYSYFCYSGKQTSEGGYIATGFGLIKTDAIGNELWNVTIPTPFTSGAQTVDGGFVIAGSTSNYYGGDAWLIKFGPEAPELQVTFSGGLGVHLKITNNGTTNANDVAWEITVQGGILGLINKTINGTVDLTPGETATVGTGILLGFGGVQTTATVADETKTADGTQFLIVTLLKK